jgi:DNA recombination protein RmuC
MQTESIYFLIGGIFLGGIVAWVIASMKAKSNNIPKSDFDSLEAGFNSIHTELGIEKEKVNHLTKINADFNAKAEENTKNIGLLASLTNENLNLEKQLENAKSELITSTTTIADKQIFIQNLEKYQSNLEANLAAAGSSIEKLNREIEDLKINLIAKTEAFNGSNEKVAELSATNKSLNEKVSDHKAAFTILEQDLSLLKINLNTRTEAFNELNEKAAGLSAVNKSLNDKISDQRAAFIILEQDLAQFKTDIKLTTEAFNESNKKVADLTAKNDSLNEKLSTQKEEIIEIQRTSQLQFEKIANQILEEKSSKFIETNKTNIEALLGPLGKNIESFKTKVEETYDKESKQRFSLEEKVKELIEQTNIVSAEANNLATALKGQAKKQGNWGEVILESILQKSGLVKDREYFIQKNIKDDEGNNLRPDVLVNLPDNRIIIIDSKVSLVAYDRFSSADKSEEQAIFLGEHLKSIRGHIDDLQGKNYDNLEASLDFTMMFIPIEPAYLIAIQGDPELWAYAYSKRILLISPTNLIACLKLIADLWKRELQSKNAMEIVRRGELLYEKFVGFVDTIEDVGKHINKTQSAYNSAIGQLKTGSGNLVGQALKLKSLGLKSNKEISPAMQPMDFETESDATILEVTKEI